MLQHFELVITADSADLAAEFDLRDAMGRQVGYRRTNFRELVQHEREELFDMRDSLRRLGEGVDLQEKVRAVGTLIAGKVLGPEIFGPLAEGKTPRLLKIRLPGAGEADDRLAAALARVPWEMARAAEDGQTLAERNLQIAMINEAGQSADQSPPLGAADDLRILFVFGAARASRPLAARIERHRLRELFQREIFPERRVSIDFLTHGVTRERLVEQFQEAGGYHILHWSGHGHQNLLELAKPDGTTDALSGEALLSLFTEAGVGIPRLVFLSACHSGEIVNVRDWKEFFRAARGADPFAKEAAAEPQGGLAHRPGFTGTAHALRAGGVPSVVAMRYSVGDDYARDLAVEFYRALLARQRPVDAAGALNAARKALLTDDSDGRRYHPCDHATPVLFGEADPQVAPAKGRSPRNAAETQRLHRVSELTADEHRSFVGRTWVLADLEQKVFGTSDDAPTLPVGAIVGLGGMGKTALAAEALDLWQHRFRFVLIYQAKPNALRLDEIFLDIDQSLRDASDDYATRMSRNSRDGIHLPAEPNFSGRRRLDRLIDNLVAVMSDDAMLIVFDNFETNLKPQPEAETHNGEPVFACRDADWDHVLTRLAKELERTRSRVLVTSRVPPAAVARHGYHKHLGPLTPGEAALFVNAHPILRPMVAAGDAERKLVQRIMAASRLHPLLLDRLGRLAEPRCRPELNAALAALEDKQKADFSTLPDLFAGLSGGDRQKEAAYLADALTGWIDLLLANAGAEARRLLWVIALANDPVAFGLLAAAWSGENAETQNLRHLQAAMLADPSSLPPDVQQFLSMMPPELRATIDALQPPPAVADPGPLLAVLAGLGLADLEVYANPNNPDVSCHELVRERIFAWHDDHKGEFGDLDPDAVRLLYAGRLEGVFYRWQHKNSSAALEAGAQAIGYFVDAGAFERLADFASGVVTGTINPSLSKRLLPKLEIAAQSAPDGRAKWRNLGNLAEALRAAGRPDMSLSYYRQAAELTKAAAEAQGSDAVVAQNDYITTIGNYANSLCRLGDLDFARALRLESAEAKKQAGHPLDSILASELEALRIDVMLGNAGAALPQIESRLDHLRSFWRRQQAGEAVAEAPERESLARALIAALDIVDDAYRTKNQWTDSLAVVDESLALKRSLNRPATDIGNDRISRIGPLLELERFDEAKSELEDCLALFEAHPFMKSKVLLLMATLYGLQNDIRQAIVFTRRALSILEGTPGPVERSMSHHNLYGYLVKSGGQAATAEAARHRLASLAYQLATNQIELLKTASYNCAVDFRLAHENGVALTIPRLADLLADPAFAALASWLKERGVDSVVLQQAIDEFLAAAEELARRWEEDPTPQEDLK